jgi:NADPH2:quinone reductase
MPHPSLPPGQRVRVSEFADNPLEAIARYTALEPQPAPDTTTLRPHEVVIAIRSVAVSWVDLLMTSGQYQHMPKPPYTPGMEYSGEVVWAGPAVDPARVAVGDRVFADFFQVGPRSYGDYQAAGGFASYAVLPQEAVLRIPESFSFDEACNLLGNYETAYHCLVVRGQVQPGETVLINGASGSTGMAAVQMAKLLGATVIATGRSDAKLAEVQAHGADHVLNTRHADDPAGVRPFRDEVKALTNGQGVDVVYDAVGGATALESLRAMAFGGRFLIVGWTSTPDVARGKGQRGAPNANQFPTNIVQMKSLTVMGCPAVIAVAKNPALRTERVAKILQWVREGRIRPRISHTFPLAEFREAMRMRWEGGITGGCVLHP